MCVVAAAENVVRECPKAGILQEQERGAGIKASINKERLSQFEERGYEAVLEL
jgi:hypothetical protein